MINVDDVKRIASKYKVYLTDKKLNDITIISNTKLKEDTNRLWPSVVDDVLSLFIGDRTSSGVTYLPLGYNKGD